MTEKQLEIYRNFLVSDQVRLALMSKKSPLVQCTILKKICDHPRRMTTGVSEAIIEFLSIFIVKI